MATMAFGNRYVALLIPAPQKASVAALKAMVGSRALSNGQNSITRSKNARKRFEFVYKGSGTALDGLQDIVDGQYGEGPWMFIHPDALNGNMLPRTWSQPARALGARGNQAMDFWSPAFAFGAPLSATLANPNEQALAITGLTGAPQTGLCLWSPSSTPPVLPVSNLTRPYLSLLIPPNYLPRITVWGLQNSATAPGLYYSLSTVGPTNTSIAAGTLIKPALAGTTVTPASAALWRVLDLWIGAGTTTTATDYTTFGALDVRMALGTAPAQPTVFDFGRGQFPCQFSEDSIGLNWNRVGVTDDQTYYELDGTMEEVTQPW